jgi:hypothetical protein
VTGRRIYCGILGVVLSFIVFISVLPILPQPNLISDWWHVLLFACGCLFAGAVVKNDVLEEVDDIPKKVWVLPLVLLFAALAMMIFEMVKEPYEKVYSKSTGYILEIYNKGELVSTDNIDAQKYHMILNRLLSGFSLFALSINLLVVLILGYIRTKTKLKKR